MDRRSFVGVMGGMGMFGTAAPAGAAESKRTQYYVIDYFYMKNGSQPARMHDYLRDGLLPALNKVHAEIGRGGFIETN